MVILENANSVVRERTMKTAEKNQNSIGDMREKGCSDLIGGRYKMQDQLNGHRRILGGRLNTTRGTKINIQRDIKQTQQWGMP